MKIVDGLKARFPKLYPTVLAVAVLGSVGGYTAYERLAGDCCYPGASCCHPGAACCAKHKAQAQR